MIELSQTPVNKSELAISMIDHDIVGLHVTMHNAFWVAIVEGFEDFEHVVPNVVVSEALVQLAEVCITCVYKFSDNRGSFSQGVSDHINQFNNVNPFLKSLQNFDFSSDLVFLDYESKIRKVNCVTYQAWESWLQSFGCWVY